MGTAGVTQIDFISVAPVMVLAAGAFLILLLEVFSPARWPRALITCCTLLLAAFTAIHFVPEMAQGQSTFSGLVFADPFSSYLSFIMILGAIIAVLLGSSRIEREGIEAPGEYYALLLMATAGCLIFVSAAEFVTFFLGLEILSMALYALCASALGSRRSTESALKYFLLGSFSSAFLLYGIAILYGLTGSMHFVTMADSLASHATPTHYVGMGLVIFGLLFKIGIAPFHFWAPDVYEGAPTSVTAYMACVVKVAAVGGALRVFWQVFGPLISVWSGVIWFAAVLTMVLGNLIALRQRSLKRMLAYSSVAHAGYILMAFLAPAEVLGGGAAILYYLVAYTAMTMGAFGIVLAVSAGESQSDDITKLNGFSLKNPLLAALMALFMLSLAGIPPGMAGMLGKFYIFNAAVKAGYIGLVVIGVISAAISCYYYLRVIVAMYFIDPEQDAVAVPASATMLVALLFCGAGVILLGLFPSVVYEGAALVTPLLR